MEMKTADKTKQESKRQSRYLFVGVAVLTLLWIIFRPIGILDNWRLGQTLDNVEEGNNKLRVEIAQMQADATDLRTNEKRIEAEARKLGLVKRGETTIMCDPPPDKSSSELQKHTNR